MRPRRLSSNALAVLVLITLIAVAYGDILFLGRGLYLMDVTSYHLPMKSIVRAIIHAGEFPSWNPFYSGGQPLAANPAYEVFYPPQWLLLILPFRFGFQLHILLHIFIAAIATFYILRDLEVGVPAAMFGSAAFVFGGPYLSLSSKLTMFFSISWMPAVLLFTRRALRRGDAASVCAAILSLGCQLLLGEPMMAGQTIALAVAVAVYEVVKASGERAAAARRTVTTLIVIGFAALCIAAAQLVPAVDFARDTVRARPFDFFYVSNWSTPPQRIVEWALPDVFHCVAGQDGEAAIGSMYVARDEPFLANIYLGIFVVLLCAGGMLAGVRGALLTAAATIASLIMAFGSHTPLLRWLYDVHLARQIRYPEKFILTAAFALAVFAAIVADRLIAGDKRVRNSVFGAAVAWLIVAAAAAAIIPDAPALGTRQYFLLNVVRAAIALTVVAVVRKRREAAVLAVAGAIAVGDLAIGTADLVQRMPASYFAPPPLARETASVLPPQTRVIHEAGWGWRFGDNLARSFLKYGRPDFWWLYRNGMFPNLPAAYGIPIALEEDIDLTSLTTTDELRQAYVSARATGDPTAVDPYYRIANIGALLRFPPLNDALRDALVTNPAGTTPVQVLRTAPAPRYWFAERIERVADALEFRGAVSRLRSVPRVAFLDLQPFAPANGEVVRSEEHSNAVRLDVSAEGRALLVLSVTAHRYWRATIDGQPATLLPANVAFQALIVPAGAHRIELRYSNPLIAIGGVISLISIAALLVSTWIFRRREQQRGEEQTA